MENKAKILYLGIGFLLYHTAISFGYLFEFFTETGLAITTINPIVIAFSKEIVNISVTLILVYFGIKYFLKNLASINILFVFIGLYIIAQVMQFLFTYYGVDFLTKLYDINQESLRSQYEYFVKYHLYLFGYLKVLLAVFMFYYFSK
jgi:glucan phosphoethanolaminetransferase (alkaline phosphatase superfamily)